MMRKRLFAVIGRGVVLAAILTGSVFARDITSNNSPKVENQLVGLPQSYESEDSEGRYVYIDLTTVGGQSEADAQ